MMKIIKLATAAIILTAIAAGSAFPCGPGWVTPVFDNERAPESPYRDFAAGNLGIIKPTYRRMVLIAAYRYLGGGGFSEPEQQALVEFWQTEINNRSLGKTDEVDAAVKAWVEQRKSVLGKETKTPDIYVERTWGGYDFFPNCTKNAFETATKTLSDRAMSYGSEDKGVRDWLRSQDQVFGNCASGRSIPDAPSADLPDWLKKDRAYQIAAANFYALDYVAARSRFAEIAQDSDSPWQEISEYLVGRTLIRQASLTGDRLRADALYLEADQALQTVSMRGGRYAEDADRLLGIVKYRLRPAERLRELAQNVASQGGYNFRQDLVDYTWLLDKYEKEALDGEEKRKAEEAARNNPESVSPTPEVVETPRPDPDRMTLYLYSEEASQSYSVEISADATDDEAIAAFEKVIGKPLSDKLKEEVRSQRRYAYQSRFSNDRDSGYQGGYWGSEVMSLALLPDILTQDEMTTWLFVYQIQSPDAYAYSLSRFRETGSALWLTAAISKAEPASPELEGLIEAARRIGPSSPAYATAAYHLARIDLARGKTAEARSLLDELVASPVGFPESTRNQFLKMRMELADGLDDFLKYAQRKPFAFDFSGSIATLDEHAAEQKSWYSPEAYPDQTREQYEKSVDEEFAKYRKAASQKMFDEDAFMLLNRYFPNTVLLAAERSEVLAPALRKRIAIALWTRAVILDDEPVAKQITPGLIAHVPELADDLAPYLKALTPVARKRAALFAIMKNPMLTPSVESGFGSDNEFGEWDYDNWWCAWSFDSENEDPKAIGSPPPFLTKAQVAAAKTERNRISQAGDAPKYFAERASEWARTAPADKRVPEALYIAWSSNSWTKYGCGNGPETQEPIENVLRARYPNSPWTRKLDEKPAEQ